MSGFYQHYLPGGGDPAEAVNPGTQDANSYLHNTVIPFEGNDPPMVSPFENLGFYGTFPDPIMFQPPKPQNARNRRKSAPGLDHVKHRRTRSGCYTCRSRRVKCDEGHPVCERCRKGKRDCVYPETTTTKGGTSTEGTGSNNPGSGDNSPDGADDEAEMDTRLESIADEDEPDEATSLEAPPSVRRISNTSTSHLPKLSTRHGSETPSLEGTKSSSPSLSTGTSVGFVTPFQSSDPSIQAGPLDWSHLSPDLQFYLDYFRENLTFYNYGVILNRADFFRNFLPAVAVRQGNEALLYAVVGFAAYHYTIHNPEGQIQDYIQYYNKSVTLLLNSIRRKEKQETATLLTILQLATIEEYLGDWVSVMGHQKAALQVLLKLFTPQTAMQSPITQMILVWYVRFDVFVGMVGGFETRMSREWFSTCVEYLEGQLKQETDDLDLRLYHASAELRLITVDMSVFYAQGGRGEISGDQFTAEHERLEQQLREWKNNLDPALTDEDYLVKDFWHRESLTEDDIVDPYKQGFLYKPPLFSTTMLLYEYYAVLVMHKSQEPRTLQEEPSDELRGFAYTICEIFETVRRWPFSPKGAVYRLQPGIAIASLFLPKDDKHRMWIRRQFAYLEGLGYVFPQQMRTRFAQMFQDMSCTDWWLPNDEGLTPIVRNTRAFADERNANPVSEQTRDLRELRAVFAKMRLDTNHDASQSPAEPSPGKGKNVMS